jgi:hypothetical protein
VGGLAVLGLTSVSVSAGPSQALLNCICQVESGCKPIGCEMDVGSLSCGYFQIKSPYYQDCGSPGSGWQTCSDDHSCAQTCVINYLNRYGTYCSGSSSPTDEDYARIHNGGPLGCRNSGTLGYWDRVAACMGEAAFVESAVNMTE